MVRYYDTIASNFFNIVDYQFNYDTIEHILEQINAHYYNKSDELLILDYGAGAGIAFDVIDQEETMKKIFLIGCDISSNMMQLCWNKQGKKIYYIEDLLIPYKKRFQGIFASFVFDLYIDSNQISQINELLVNNGIFIFNIHKGNKIILTRIRDILIRGGFDERNIQTYKKHFLNRYTNIFFKCTKSNDLQEEI